MASRLADAHLDAQARLRALVDRGIRGAWAQLPGYDEEHAEAFIARVAPFVAAAQREGVVLTDAYLARALARRPLGLNAAQVIAALRPGVDPGEQWRRPFVTVWTALAAGVLHDQAVRSGLARATELAATDVQLAHRGALQAAQDRDRRIGGYQRAANAGACAYCVELDGVFVRNANAMALHAHCGCGLEPVGGQPAVSPIPEGVAVREHGELGAVIGDPAHAFTGPADI